MSNRSMTKAQLIKVLSDRSGVTRVQATRILKALASTAYKEAKRGLTIPGLGTLVVVKRKKRTDAHSLRRKGAHISTNTTVEFRVAKAFERAVLSTPGEKRTSREDRIDSDLIARRRNEPSRPLREFLRERGIATR